MFTHSPISIFAIETRKIPRKEWNWSASFSFVFSLFKDHRWKLRGVNPIGFSSNKSSKIDLICAQFFESGKNNVFFALLRNECMEYTAFVSISIANTWFFVLLKSTPSPHFVFCWVPAADHFFFSTLLQTKGIISWLFLLLLLQMKHFWYKSSPPCRYCHLLCKICYLKKNFCALKIISQIFFQTMQKFTAILFVCIAVKFVSAAEKYQPGNEFKSLRQNNEKCMKSENIQVQNWSTRQHDGASASQKMCPFMIFK